MPVVRRKSQAVGQEGFSGLEFVNFFSPIFRLFSSAFRLFFLDFLSACRCKFEKKPLPWLFAAKMIEFNCEGRNLQKALKSFNFSYAKRWNPSACWDAKLKFSVDKIHSKLHKIPLTVWILEFRGFIPFIRSDCITFLLTHTQTASSNPHSFDHTQLPLNVVNETVVVVVLFVVVHSHTHTQLKCATLSKKKNEEKNLVHKAHSWFETLNWHNVAFVARTLKHTKFLSLCLFILLYLSLPCWI